MTKKFIKIGRGWKLKKRYSKINISEEFAKSMENQQLLFNEGACIGCLTQDVEKKQNMIAWLKGHYIAQGIWLERNKMVEQPKKEDKKSMDVNYIG